MDLYKQANQDTSEKCDYFYHGNVISAALSMVVLELRIVIIWVMAVALIVT